MAWNDPLIQLLLLLWKCWLTMIRSKGWMITQCVITILMWAGLLIYEFPLKTKLNADNDPSRRLFNGNLFPDGLLPSLDYTCEGRNGGVCSDNIEASLASFCQKNNVRNKRSGNNPEKKIFACSHTNGYSSVNIREFNKSTVDIEFSSHFVVLHICKPHPYASSQFDNIPREGCEDYPIVHAISQYSGKISQLEINYFDSLKFRSEHYPWLWTEIGVMWFTVWFFFMQISREVSQETNNLMKDYLLSMGMSRIMYFLHHVIFNFLKLLIVVIGFSIILGAAYKSIGLGFYLFAIFSLTICPCICIAIVIGSCFKKPGTSTAASLFMWLIMMMTPILPFAPHRTNALSILCSLNPLFAIGFFFDAKRESDLRGINLWFSEVTLAVPQGYFLFMLIFDTVFYFFLAVFIDWLRSSFENPLTMIMKKKTEIGEESQRLLDNHEKEESQNNHDILIEGVHKVYSTGEHAVRGVYMTMNKGQVTALLGHNGAGKSTIFSMISGMTVPTQGKIQIMDKENLEDRQKLIGFCPQYNPIFPKLTVDEHLKFFARLKGIGSSNDIGSKVLVSLGMTNMGKCRAVNLSGGMKRKLSIAISMAADSPIILLDEPTAGLDPGARRDFERLLLEWKKDHTILLTTHYTDEAEMLADRIFIMARGRVYCSGSPQFLRKKFDSGFVLSFAVENESDNERASNEMMKIAQEFVSFASLSKSRGKQFELKLSTEDSTKFVEMFKKIESIGPSVGIQSYGLSLTKLEQVFLKVGEMTGTVDRCEEVQTALKELIVENGKRAKGPMKIMKQMGYIVMKRLHFDIAHIVSLFFNLLILFFLTCLFISAVKSSDNSKKNMLTIPECYRIGVDHSVQVKTDIEKISKRFGKCLTIERIPSISTWYSTQSTKRPPILAGFSRDGTHGDKWTIHIHPRNKIYLSALEMMAAMINNNETKFVNLEGESDKKRNERVSEINRKWDKDLEKAGITDNKRENEKNEKAITFFLVFAATFPSLILRPISFYIIEKTTNFGHQERLTGISPFIFYISSILYDFFLNILHFVVFIGACLTSENKFMVYIPIEKCIYMSFIGFLSGELIILIMFRVFSTPMKAFCLLYFMHFLFGCCAWLIEMFGGSIPNINENPFLLFSPLISASVWDFRKPKSAPIFIFIHLIILIVIFTLLELRLRAVMKRSKNKNEVNTVEEGGKMSNDSIILRVNNLNKWYGRGKKKFHAVKGISFGVRSHECFGVLGINGAGKSSAFEMLTGNTLPDIGWATVGGIDCSTPATIGYCPQTDALIEDLSGRQSLIILAAQHGYANPRNVADIVITCVGMQDHADKKSKTYSGGQRRKISVAASLLAQNSLIILDEPTAGVDPIARRDIWSVICALRESTNTAIVLTSHSMDEVEALVSNLIIMREGSIVVEGSPQMIKNKFGDHYNFNLVIENVSDVGEITTQIVSIFPNASLYDSASLRNIKYRIPRQSSDVFSEIFQKAATISGELKAIDFCFTQATLEDAFMLAASASPQPIEQPTQPEVAPEEELKNDEPILNTAREE